MFSLLKFYFIAQTLLENINGNLTTLRLTLPVIGICQKYKSASAY